MVDTTLDTMDVVVAIVIVEVGRSRSVVVFDITTTEVAVAPDAAVDAARTELQ